MILIFYGILIGIFITLIGGGGASLYLGVLVSQFKMPLEIAVPTSLFVALPPLIIAFFAQNRSKNVNFYLGNRMIISSIPGIIIGTFISKYIDTNLYNIIVGSIFIIMGLLVLIKFSRKKDNTSNVFQKNSGKVAFLLGFLSGLMVGIGGLSGGATTVAGLSILGLSAIESAGTTTFVLCIMSIFGLITHLFTGRIDWLSGVGLMLGAMIGSGTTPFILNKLDSTKVNKYLTPLLAFVIIYFGLQMLFLAT